MDGDISIDPVALSYVLGSGPGARAPVPAGAHRGERLHELNYITNSARPQDPGKVYLPPFGELMTRDLLQAPVELPELTRRHAEGCQKHIALNFHNQPRELVVGAGAAVG